MRPTLGSMYARFDLWSCQGARDNAAAILVMLHAGTMHCDGPSSADDIDRFAQWIAGGTAE